MKLRALAFAALLLAAAVPSLSSPASAAWRAHHGWSSVAAYYPRSAIYYSAPYDNYGPVGPFVGYEAGYSDGHWHPAYWRLGRHGYRYAGSWW